MALDAGSRVSHYRLLRRLGAGGMGEVFLAEDDDLERPVAIKFLLGTSDDHARKRLLQEARAVASLDHPGICAVYEIGSDAAGGDFIVMQYVDGESLHARLQRGRLAPAEALALAAHIAEALRAAHARGIVHRDLKPQNIMITPAGEPKLLDFGLAKRVAAAAQAAEAQTATQLTQPYAVMGTPGYMSPEQIRGQPADYRSDLFALGCVLYECLTGHRAFNGQTAADIASEVLQIDPPPVSSLAPGLDASHDVLVARLLTKAPEDRFQSAGDALGAIRVLLPSAISSRTAIGTGAVARPRRSARTWALAAIAVALTALAIWQWPWSGRVPEPPPEAARWYRSGVEALREGTYVGARVALEEAIRLYPDYMQAYARLADALTELDDERGAQEALLRVAALGSEGFRLTAEDQLRLEATRFSVLRDHPKAISASDRLVSRYAGDAGTWVDLGRAHEAASQLLDARQHYAKAVSIDKLYAAAHMRLGTALARTGEVTAGLNALDEAIRLFQIGSRVEGEAEALLRKVELLTPRGAYAEANAALKRVLQLSESPSFISQRARARFELARLTAVSGNLSEAERIARAALAETPQTLQTVAASGLVGLANTLMAAGQFDAADAHLTRAIDLARSRGAGRTAARAQLQQASLRLQSGRHAEAIALAAEPLKFFTAHHHVRHTAEGKLVLSRAHEELEDYAEASRLAGEVLTIAESTKDRALLAGALESLAGQLTAQGRLPEALQYRQRIEQIHRAQTDHGSLAFDLPNRAELLIRLGRGQEAETALEEVDTHIAAGIEVYIDRKDRVAALRALRAAVEGRPADALAHAGAAGGVAPGTGPSPDNQGESQLLAAVLIEHSAAALGRPRTAPARLQAWLRNLPNAPVRRELSYWVAITLLIRNEPEVAYSVAQTHWQDTATTENVELRWRLAAISLLAGKAVSKASDSATMRAHAQSGIQQLDKAWLEDARRYFARQDLAFLRRMVFDER